MLVISSMIPIVTMSCILVRSTLEYSYFVKTRGTALIRAFVISLQMKTQRKGFIS